MPIRKKRVDSYDRLFLSIVIAGVIYCDVAMILKLSDQPIKLPIGNPAAYYNAMFRVFNYWSDRCYGYVGQADVRPREAPDSKSEIREFHIHELFPMPRGESYTRITGLCNKDVNEFTRQLKQIYQRQHPDIIVDRVRLYSATWPSSTESLFTRYGERKLTRLSQY